MERSTVQPPLAESLIKKRFEISVNVRREIAAEKLPRAKLSEVQAPATTSTEPRDAYRDRPSADEPFRL